MTAKQEYAAKINAALFKALSNPIRQRIMVKLDEGQHSPTELAEELGETVEATSHHVRVLNKAGLIELVDTDTRRGGVQHFYKAIARPIFDTTAWESLPQLLREVESVWTAQTIVGELREAFEARTFDSHPGRALVRMNIVVDDQGFGEIEAVEQSRLDALHDIAARSAARMEKSNDPGFTTATAAMAYPKP
jgi:DNA-binding transcriptional ArsR family regulator